MKRIASILLVIATTGVATSCKKEDPRLANGYFDISAVSPIVVTNYYGSVLSETTLFDGKSMQIGYLVSDYVFIRCKTSSGCMYFVNGTIFTDSRKFTPPNR